MQSTEAKEICQAAAIANVKKDNLGNGVVIYKCTDGKKFFQRRQAENVQLKIEEMKYAHDNA